MSTSDIAELFGWLFAAWSAGFTGGYIITQYKRAIDAASS